MSKDSNEVHIQVPLRRYEACVTNLKIIRAALNDLGHMQLRKATSDLIIDLEQINPNLVSISSLSMYPKEKDD